MATSSHLNPHQFLTADCEHCDRQITHVRGEGWVNREAPLTGDDSMWRETCEGNDKSIFAEHAPRVSN